MRLILIALALISSIEPNIKVNYEKNCFSKNDVCFQYVSGTFHYFRTHRDQWEDRIKRMKAGGLNAIQTYIAWNYHEVYPGSYDFKGNADISYFLHLIHKHDMYAIVRPGPYIDAEWEFGGFPYYLLSNRSKISLRTSRDSFYLQSVERWYKVLLPVLSPHTFDNGGPIISVQIENEFGTSHNPDEPYTSLLVNLTIKYLGDRIIRFTTDGSWAAAINNGSVPNAYAGIDFGPGNVYDSFRVLRDHNPRGPLLNSEYYPAWFTTWGGNRVLQDVNKFISSFNQMLYMRADISIYVYEGGTNWGYYAGGYYSGNRLSPIITSYDYSAPLSEGGEYTPLYFAIRNSVIKYLGWDLPPVPPPIVNGKLQRVALSSPQNIFHFYEYIQNGSVTTKYPLNFEDVDQPYGFLMYSLVNKWRFGSKFVLTCTFISDIAHIYINEEYTGVINATNPSIVISSVNIRSLALLVENQGRSCNNIDDNFKGLLANVTITVGNVTTILTDWVMTRIEFGSLFPHIEEIQLRESLRTGRGLYFGQLVLSGEIQSTYLNMSHWGRGVVFVNGVNLGRYWNVGPQHSLYLPYPYLKDGVNYFVVLEFDDIVSSGYLEFSDHSIWS